MKTTLLEKLLDKTSEALGIRKKQLQKKLIERSLEGTIDSVDAVLDENERRKVLQLENLAKIQNESAGQLVFKELARLEQEILNCKNTKVVLNSIKEELNTESEETKE
jgi:hypothetical protein